MKTPSIDDESVLRAASLSEMIAHITETHHTFVRAQAQLIEHFVEELFSLDPGNTRIAEIRRLNQTLQFELADHMRKEEDVLFPAIISLEKASKVRPRNGKVLPFKISNRVRLLMLEDEGTAYLLKHLTEAVFAFHPTPQSQPIYQKLLAAVEVFESDLKRHIHVENSILFPKAISVEEDILTG